MQKANGRAPEGVPVACGRAISGLFHSPPGVLFTFPSRYSCAIGRRLVFSLAEWSPRVRAGFHVSRPTRDPGGARGASGTGLSPPAAGPSRPFPSPRSSPCAGPTTPGGRPPGLGSPAFARRYLRVLCRFLFLRVLRCFTSPGVAPPPYLCSGGGARPLGRAGSPIRAPPDRRMLAPPRGFSQLAAPFVAMRLLGIRRAPVCAWPAPPSAAAGLSATLRLSLLPMLPCCQRTWRPPARPSGAGGPENPEPRPPPAPPRGAGGRAWSRTRDLVLIRDAL